MEEKELIIPTDPITAQLTKPVEVISPDFPYLGEPAEFIRSSFDTTYEGL
ncbi:MAG: hypothetical protein MI748_07350 [Opitutales bacterium]|nr:hypothetical protein [Opitutales bacterium]